MDNDENNNKPESADNDETKVTPELASADKSDMVDQIEREIRARAKNASVSPGENPDGVRDLTDEELRVLKRKFQEGLQTLKDHPWSGKKDEN